MQQDNYTNRELDTKFEQIVNLLHEIRDQTTKTNGRVTKLEFWKEGITAKLTVILATIGIAWVLFKEFIIKII